MLQISPSHVLVTIHNYALYATCYVTTIVLFRSSNYLLFRPSFLQVGPEIVFVDIKVLCQTGGSMAQWLAHLPHVLKKHLCQTSFSVSQGSAVTLFLTNDTKRYNTIAKKLLFHSNDNCFSENRVAVIFLRQKR